MRAPAWVRRPTSGPPSFGRYRAPLVSTAIVLAAVIASCSGTSSPSPSLPSTGPLPTATDLVPNGPAPTNWPTTVVDGVIALGAADKSFAQMNSDVTTAVNAADPGKILTVMNDALKFLRPNLRFLPYLQGYPATKDVGDKLAAAYNQLVAGAQAIVDGVNAGDGEAVQQGFNQFFAGDAAYSVETGPLADLVQQALLMRRNLTQ